MIDQELLTTEMRASLTTVLSYVPTWRFIGDRIAADLAYCTRFGMDEAPEPTIALGGAWAYTLPVTEPTQ